MGHIDNLILGKFYHIYNCGINGENIYLKDKDHLRFLELLYRYVSPVADIYAWCMMKNHFHLLVKIKENIVYKYNKHDVEDKTFEELKWETIALSDSTISCPSDDEMLKNKKPTPSRHFAHLFNAYSKYFNTKYERHGSLFERPFKRKVIENVKYLQRVVVYIHNNPVHHGFCKSILGYPWTSYHTCISIKPTKLFRQEVIGWFDDKGNFVDNHNKIFDLDEFNKWLDLT